MLRDTIPKMLDSLVQKQASRKSAFVQHPALHQILTFCVADIMFAEFMKAVNEAQGNVKEFSDLMRDDKSKEVFAMADKSKEENPFGIKPWRHKDHPNWFNLEKDD
jgi:hypothetical protein